MKAIVGSGIAFIVFAIALVLRITIGSLTDQYDFLTDWLVWFNVVVIVAAAIFALFVVLAIIMAIADRKKGRR